MGDDRIDMVISHISWFHHPVHGATGLRRPRGSIASMNTKVAFTAEFV